MFTQSLLESLNVSHFHNAANLMQTKTLAEHQSFARFPLSLFLL